MGRDLQRQGLNSVSNNGGRFHARIGRHWGKSQRVSTWADCILRPLLLMDQPHSIANTVFLSNLGGHGLAMSQEDYLVNIKVKFYRISKHCELLFFPGFSSTL